VRCQAASVFERIESFHDGALQPACGPGCLHHLHARCGRHVGIPGNRCVGLAGTPQATPLAISELASTSECCRRRQKSARGEGKLPVLDGSSSQACVPDGPIPLPA
jgi:hypothetical protein